MFFPLSFHHSHITNYPQSAPNFHVQMSDLCAAIYRWVPVDGSTHTILRNIRRGRDHLCICGKYSHQKCQRCKKQYYCSQLCQQKHWVNHRTMCNKKKSRLNISISQSPDLFSRSLDMVIS